MDVSKRVPHPDGYSPNAEPEFSVWTHEEGRDMFIVKLDGGQVTTSWFTNVEGLRNIRDACNEMLEGADALWQQSSSS